MSERRTIRPTQPTTGTSDGKGVNEDFGEKGVFMLRLPCYKDVLESLEGTGVSRGEAGTISIRG
jgi:hypothetical protein